MSRLTREDRPTILKFSIYFIAAAIFLCAAVFVSCKNGPNDSRLTIKGSFNGGTNARGFSAADILASLLGRGRLYALNATDVAKVAIFEGHNGYMISDVVGGSFSIDAQAGKPTGMIFIGAANNFLGYLTLGSGMESIPLNMTADGVKTIDLQSLSSTLGIVDPGHNPVGSEILMTSGDIVAYAFGNGPYASVVKSPDIDGDGVVDITNGYFFRYYVSYDVGAGSFGTKLTGTMLIPVNITGYRLGIKVTDPDRVFPGSITITGAAGSGMEAGVPNDMLMRFPSPDGSMCSYYSPPQSIPPIPPAGAYVVSYKSKTLTFNVPDQSSITNYLAIPVPSVVLNANGTIHKITWEYKLSDGSAPVDPKALVDYIGIQIDVPPNTFNVHSYSVYNLPGSTTEHILSDQGIYWDCVAGLSTGYTDVFGDDIGVLWSKP